MITFPLWYEVHINFEFNFCWNLHITVHIRSCKQKQEGVYWIDRGKIGV